MTWWAWLLIWTGLVLGLLGMLALSAWLLFRKFMTLMDDLAELADRAAILESPDLELVRPPIAVLSAASDIREREAARRQHRAERRQLRHDARIARATAITRLDPRAKAALVASVRERWSAAGVSR